MGPAAFPKSPPPVGDQGPPSLPARSGLPGGRPAVPLPPAPAATNGKDEEMYEDLPEEKTSDDKHQKDPPKPPLTVGRGRGKPQPYDDVYLAPSVRGIVAEMREGHS
jgi:hypothetical protein